MRRKFKGKSRKAYLKCLYLVPFKTGKLRNQGLKYNELGQNSLIYVDLNITPYAAYINRPGYRTHGWFNRFCDRYEKELRKMK